MIAMTFCPKCGKEVAKDDYFCSNCDVKTRKGLEIGVPSPNEELEAAFSRMGQEMEKAFLTIAREMQKAFRTTRENIRESGSGEAICSRCGKKNQRDANFCYKCSHKLNPE